MKDKNGSGKMLRMDHIGVAVRDLEEALRVFHGILGLPVTYRERLEGFGIEVASLPIGEVTLELMEAFDEDCAVARFLRKKGPGVQHVCFRVDDLEAMLRTVGEELELIDRVPKRGAGGHRIAFLHPRSTSEILVELLERVDG